MNLETSLAGLRLSHPILIGAGLFKLEHELAKALLIGAAGVEIGGFTYESREGNKDGRNFESFEYGALNSRGLPNLGINYLRQHLNAMVAMAHAAKKVLLVNVAGDNPDQFAELAMVVIEGGADGVVVNVGCPNKWSGDKQERVISYDPRGFELVLQAVCENVRSKYPNARIFVKLSPYFDYVLLAEIDSLINIYKPAAVIATNTAPNGYWSKDGQPLLTVTKGFGGYSGVGLRPISRGNTRLHKQYLDPEIDLVAVGGINSGRCVDESITEDGATAVQVVTAIGARHERDDVIGRMLTDYVEILEARQPATV